MKQIFIALGAAITSIACLGATAQAQTAATYNWVPTGAANWNLNANWNDPINAQNFVPDANQFDERAMIGNGGTAFVQAPSPTPPGALLITNGTAEIRSGGVLNVIESINALWPGTVALTAGANQTANLVVLPGGTLTTESLLYSAASASNIITVGGVAAGTATVNVPAAALEGTTRIHPNAAVTTTGSVTFGPAGIYQPQINGASSATLNIGQNAILGGTLNATFTGAAPAVGAAWPLMQADSIVGEFATVTSSLTLPANQRFITHRVPVGARQRLDLELREILVMNVNRDSGVISVSHPGASAIQLDSYSIVSSQGRMVSGPWNSLADQAAYGGSWNEATPNANSISELRSGGNGTAAAASNVIFGAIYNPLAGTFAAEVDDLSFQYSDSAGRMYTGVVNYTGTRLNNLLLQVDPTSGKARLRNTSATTVDVEGYVISSTASITPGTWSSLDDQNVGGADKWLELLTPTAAQIGEVTVAPLTLGPGASYDLGTVFSTAAARDLAFEFLLEGEFEATLGAVVYEAIGNANFDGDSDVDGNDFLRWQRGLGNGTTLGQGDANGDGAVTAADLAIWKSQFGQGSAALPAVGAVPEPMSAALLCVGALGLLVARRSLLGTAA